MNTIQQYPEILALLFIGIGFVAAHLLARWSRAGVGLLESGLRRVSPQWGDLPPGAENTIVRIVYFSVLGLFILLATRSLGVHLVGQGLDAVIVYIPRLLLGGAIIFGGYLLGIVVRGLMASTMMYGTDSLLPQVVQYLIVIAAVITGLGQMAVDVSFLATLVIVVISALLGSLSLAFALGSREVVANLLSRRELDRYQVGDRVRIETAEGRIVEITRTGVLLEGEDGLTYVPASRFATSIVVQREADADADD